MKPTKEEAVSEMPSLVEAVEFAENPEPRCPCVLLLDTSSSMQGAPIDALNQGLRTFKDELMTDPLASRRVEVAVVTFDSEVRVIQDFVTADQFQPPTLAAARPPHHRPLREQPPAYCGRAIRTSQQSSSRGV